MGPASVGATEEEVRAMRATILDLIARGRLQILVKTGWHQTEPGTHIWVSLDKELIHSILLPEEDDE